jgi:hypothetical protein
LSTIAFTNQRPRPPDHDNRSRDNRPYNNLVKIGPLRECKELSTRLEARPQASPVPAEKNVQQGGKRHDGRNGEQDDSVPPWADALEVGDTPPVIALALPVLRQIGQSNASDHWADSAQGDEDKFAVQFFLGGLISVGLKLKADCRLLDFASSA